MPLNRVWFSRSWVFRVYNFTIKRLEKSVFLHWKPFRECVSPVKQGTKWTIFVLTRVGVWRSRRHSSTQTSFECPPRKVRKFGGNWREGTASQFREWKFITLPFWFSTVLACVAGAKRRGGGDKSAKGKRESLNKPLSATPSLFPFLPIPQPIKSRH